MKTEFKVEFNIETAKALLKDFKEKAKSEEAPELLAQCEIICLVLQSYIDEKDG